MEKEAIHPNGAVTYAPYTPAVVVGREVYLSGQIDVDAGDDIISQTRGALAKMDVLLKDAGASKHDLVFVQVLLKSMDFYAPMNEVYEAWLEGVAIKPARAAFAVDARLALREHATGVVDVAPGVALVRATHARLLLGRSVLRRALRGHGVDRHHGAVGSALAGLRRER